MASGDSAAERAAAKRATAARYRIRADRAEQAAQLWSKGAEGERVLAELTAPLGADGYYRLDDRRLPGSTANLDHLLVGPVGVFVVDAKSWTGRLQVEGTSLRQNGRRRDDHLERLRVQSVEVSTTLEEFMGRRRVEVRPVLCFVGEARLGARACVDRVHLLDSDDLVEFIRGFEKKLDQSSVDEVMSGLLERLPARAAPLSGGVTGTPPAPAPSELVVFLQPWNKHGHRRLYVKSNDGSEVGFLNLITGEVHVSADGWAPILGQLLPHYLTDRPGGSKADELSGEARGVFRRFVDAVLRRGEHEPARAILAGYHWRGYGEDRLYLRRIDPRGAKHELGWFDLERGNARSRDPRAAAVLGYCGDRFRQVVQR